MSLLFVRNGKFIDGLESLQTKWQMWSKNCNMYAASRGPLWKWQQNFNWNALSKAAVCTQKCKIWKVLNTSGTDIWFKPKGSFGLKTILHKESFAMMGNVHFKLGFIDKLVWHFEKLHKFQFNQQGGGRGDVFIDFLSSNSAINHKGGHLQKSLN